MGDYENTEEIMSNKTKKWNWKYNTRNIITYNYFEVEIINTDEEKKIQDTINKEMRYMGLMCVIRLKNVKKLIYTTAIKLLVIFT